MTAFNLAKPYLEINGLLLFSYLLFFTLRRIIEWLSLKIRYRHALRIGQLLIAVSVLTPLATLWIPTQHIPEVHWSVFTPASEMDVAIRKLHKNSRKSPAIRPIDPTPIGVSQNFLSEWLTFSALTWAMALIFAAIAGSLFRLRRRSLSLRTLLNSACTVRNVGQVRVVVSEMITIPFSARATGISWIALPDKILSRAADYRLALRHELQHHRDKDTLWAVAIEILICFFFLNPAIYLWKREIIELQEFSCDESLIGRQRVRPHDYGSCLMRVAETAARSRQIHAGTTCMASGTGNPFYTKSFLRRRIEMFPKYIGPRARPWAGAFAGTLALITTMATLALAFGAERSFRSDALPAANPGVVVVDPLVQTIAENALGEAIRKFQARSGFAIVADPATGRILAIANIDTSSGTPPSKYWALGQVLEPASLAKTFVAAQAIESGLTSPQDTHNCEKGSYTYGGRTYHEWKKGGWDQQTTEDTIVFSSDICAIKIGEQIGEKGLRQMLTQFGFGPGGTASTFPEARPGILPPVENPAYPDLIPSISAGYGFGASPLELLQAYGAIANGGVLMQPLLASQVDSRPIRRIFSAETAEKMRSILRQVVIRGTGKEHAGSSLYTTAGKTATSYVPDLTQWSLVDGKQDGNFGGFIGFAPVNKPRIEIYVGIRDPRANAAHGAHGGWHAAPVFKQIAEQVLEQMQVPPDQPQG